MAQYGEQKNPPLLSCLLIEKDKQLITEKGHALELELYEITI